MRPIHSFMIPMVVLAGVPLVGGGLAGCGAKPKVVDISGMPPASEFEGVPTRIVSRQQVRVYAKQPDNTYKLVHQQLEELPDQSRLFATTIDADWLSNHKLVMSTRENGTIEKVETTITSQAGAALAQAATSTGAVVKGVADLDKTQKEREAKEATDFAAQEAAILAYRTKLEEVLKLQRELEGNLTPDQRFEKESSLRLRKLEANQAARKLKREAPYPEADQLP